MKVKEFFKTCCGDETISSSSKNEGFLRNEDSPTSRSPLTIVQAKSKKTKKLFSVHIEEEKEPTTNIKVLASALQSQMQAIERDDASRCEGYLEVRNREVEFTPRFGSSNYELGVPIEQSNPNFSSLFENDQGLIEKPTQNQQGKK
jgi:hypothetical protein